VAAADFQEVDMAKGLLLVPLAPLGSSHKEETRVRFHTARYGLDPCENTIINKIVNN
jgi:hypothetical protein